MAGLKPKPTAYEKSSDSYETFENILLMPGAQTRLLDRNAFGAFFFLFLLRQIQFQHAILIFSLDTIGIDPVVQVEAAFKALEREFLSDGLVFFRLCLFLLLKGDGQLALVYRQLEIFLASAGGAQFQMISFLCLVDIHRRKGETAFTTPAKREIVKKFIYKAGQVPGRVVVYFYECHSAFLFKFYQFCLTVRREQTLYHGPKTPFFRKN